MHFNIFTSSAYSSDYVMGFRLDILISKNKSLVSDVFNLQGLVFV